MISLKYFICSQGSSIDKDTNTVSLFNIVEEFGISKLPFTFPYLVLTCFLENKESEKINKFDFVLKIINNKKEILQEKFVIYFGDKYFHKLRINIPNMLIEEFGELKFFLIHKKTELGVLNFKVKKITPQIPKE